MKIRQDDDFHFHRVSRFTISVLRLADVLAGVRRDGFVDAVLAADNVGSSLVEDPTNFRLRNSVCVAQQGKTVSIENDLLGRTSACDDGCVDDNPQGYAIVGGVEDCQICFSLTI